MVNYSWLQFSTLHRDDYPALFKLALSMNTEIYLSQLERKQLQSYLFTGLAKMLFYSTFLKLKVTIHM